MREFAHIDAGYVGILSLLYVFVIVACLTCEKVIKSAVRFFLLSMCIKSKTSNVFQIWKTLCLVKEKMKIRFRNR